MPTVLSTHPLHPHAAAMLGDAATLAVASALDAATLVREAAEADVVIVRAPLPPALFDAAPRLRAAVRHGAGLDMIPLDAATAAGVLVANVPGVNARTVAEHVIFAAIALLRRFRMVDRDLRGAGWLAGRAHSDLGHDLAGRRLGIVGFGAVGRALFAIARLGFGLDVLVHTRTPAPLPDGAVAAGMDELSSRADVLVLCCPLTPETTGLLSAARIAAMKPGAILVNVSRGPVIDEAALIAALRGGHIAGAALDVFATQPLPPDHPFFGFENVLLTPHMAGITEESMMRMGTGAVEEALRVLRGELPLNLRNPEALPRHRARFPGH